MYKGGKLFHKGLCKVQELGKLYCLALWEAKQTFFTRLKPTSKYFWETLKQINGPKTTITLPQTIHLLLLQMLRRPIIRTKTSQSISIQLLQLSPNEYDLLVGVSVTNPTAPDNIAGLMIKSTSCSITSAVGSPLLGHC